MRAKIRLAEARSSIISYFKEQSILDEDQERIASAYCETQMHVDKGSGCRVITENDELYLIYTVAPNLPEKLDVFSPESIIFDYSPAEIPQAPKKMVITVEDAALALYEYIQSCDADDVAMLLDCAFDLEKTAFVEPGFIKETQGELAISFSIDPDRLPLDFKGAKEVED